MEQQLQTEKTCVVVDVQNKRYELLLLLDLGILKLYLETCPPTTIEKLWKTVSAYRSLYNAERLVDNFIDLYANFAVQIGVIESTHVPLLKKDLSNRVFRDELIISMSPIMRHASWSDIFLQLKIITAKYANQTQLDQQKMEEIAQFVECIRAVVEAPLGV